MTDFPILVHTRISLFVTTMSQRSQIGFTLCDKSPQAMTLKDDRSSSEGAVYTHVCAMKNMPYATLLNTSESQYAAYNHRGNEAITLAAFEL